MPRAPAVPFGQRVPARHTVYMSQAPIGVLTGFIYVQSVPWTVIISFSNLMFTFQV